MPERAIQGQPLLRRLLKWERGRPAGAKKDGRSLCGNRGMTMLEILTVVTVLAVLMGLSFPLMRSMNESNKLRATAREIIALMKYARAEAVMGQRMTEVFIDLEKRQFWLDLREPDQKTGIYKSGGKKSQMEHKRSLNQDIWFDEANAYESNLIKDKMVAVDFYPDGSASPTMLTLTNNRGSKTTIDVIKSTGLTEVAAGSIADKKAKQEALATPPPYNTPTPATKKTATR
ncbi:MAG: GspH/FimT family pseudopilin [bacterium]